MSHNIGKNKELLGILGGLGPLASAYFYELITEHTKALKDQDHIDIILSSRATTPDRTDFILGKSDESPLPYMIEDAVLLEKYGADVIVIPCNTAHYFVDEIRKKVSVPVPSIIDETADHIRKCGYKSALILATDGTLSVGSYQSALEDRGIVPVVPSDEDRKAVMDIIYGDVKQGRVPEKEKLFAITGKYFESGEAECAILGCTELSVMKRNFREESRFVDSLEALAHKAITMLGHETAGFGKDYE